MTQSSDTVIWDAVDLNRLGDLARLLVCHAPKDLCVGLVGTLGAGKTRFVQTVANYLGIESDDVTSPTFSLVQSYRSASPGSRCVELHHVDAYRITDADEWFETGLEELLDEDETKQDACWRFVEWADRFEDLMPPATLWIRIQIDPSDGDLRQIVVVSADDCHEPFLDSIRGHG